jgi:hypothetical protein
MPMTTRLNDPPRRAIEYIGTMYPWRAGKLPRVWLQPIKRMIGPKIAFPLVFV